MEIMELTDIIKVDHELKIAPEYFEAVSNGTKTFEIRRNDRDFKVGDIIKLKEFSDHLYTGPMVLVKVLGVFSGLSDYGVDPEYVVLSIKVVENRVKWKQLINVLPIPVLRDLRVYVLTRNGRLFVTSAGAHGISIGTAQQILGVIELPLSYHGAMWAVIQIDNALLERQKAEGNGSKV